MGLDYGMTYVYSQFGHGRIGFDSTKTQDLREIEASVRSNTVDLERFKGTLDEIKYRWFVKSLRSPLSRDQHQGEGAQ